MTSTFIASDEQRYDGAQEVWYAQQAYQRSVSGDRTIRSQAARDAKERYGRVIGLAARGDRVCIDEVVRLSTMPAVVKAIGLDEVAVLGALPGPEFD
ncbi:MAG: hypothetical protein ACRDYV_21850, partial [Acidimicrobiia bacterium]